MTSTTAPKPPINWVTTIMFVTTFLVAAIGVPLYAWYADFSAAAWGWFAFFLIATGISITAGYHRLWSHGAYEAHWSVRLFFMIFGGMAIQNSILIWCAGHRPHHRFVDDVDRDPYAATRGLWFSHIGWMLRSYPSGEPDFACVRDLEKDAFVAWQHRHYVPLVLGTNIGLPFLVGWLSGDVWGCVLLAGFLRLVINHHVTFFINSLAHYRGAQPYTDRNTAKDNWFIAFFTYGEGYHNFHHIFQHDYRNGVRWYQYDPTKWLIRGLAAVGLAGRLRTTPAVTIERAKLDMQFRRAEQRLARVPARLDLTQLRERVQQEYAAFVATLAEWNATREQWAQAAKERVAKTLEGVDMQAYARQIERRLRAQRRRVHALTLQMA